jgi:pimeloyl-ACP methyl ester carboxylesterase
VTLQSCVNKVCNIIRTKSDPVILVGHSISGIIISQVAEQIPDKIRTLVFLTAYLLQDGESLNSVLERCRHLISFSPDHSYFTINNKKADLFYNNCSAEDVTRAKKLLCSESTAFFKTPVRLSNENFGVVPRIYIECLHDQIISPRDQKAMYTTTPCLKVISLNTGHSPFFSTPELLAAHLASIAN